MAKTPEEKEALRLAKEEAKAAKLAEKEAKKAAKEAEKVAKVDVVNPHNLAEYYVRTYSEERHGENYLELAEEFATAKGYKVVAHEKERIPGYKPGVPGNEK